MSIVINNYFVTLSYGRVPKCSKFLTDAGFKCKEGSHAWGHDKMDTFL
jgi:hypothetical protein